MGLLKKLGLAAETAKDVLKSGCELASKDEQERRLAICAGCPKAKTTAGMLQCGECGCFMKAKAKLQEAKCPCGKW